MRVTLTPRDFSLFASLRRFRFLTTEQVEQLHFPSRQTMLRRVRLLSRSGHLTIVRAGSLGTRVVALGKRGAEAITEPNRRAWYPRPAARSELFLAHAAAVNEFQIRLDASCRNSDELELLGFISEAERTGSAAHSRPWIADTVTSPGTTLERVPDGVFAVRRGERAALFFVEVDRSTEVVLHPERGLARVMRFYAACLMSDVYQRYAAVFGVEAFRGFRALFVFRSDRRLRSVRERCGRLADVPTSAKRFIWLATEAAVCSGELTTASWVSLDPMDETVYAITGSGERRECP
jgi:hypothetical protein